MTATFATAHPRTGDVISAAPGVGTWKATFRMRVTQVITDRRLDRPIIGGVVINKDGSDRKANAERAFDYRADLVTLVTPAQPTSVDLDQAYARQAAIVRTEADQGAYMSGPVASDVSADTRALVARAEANARRTTDQTAEAFLNLAGQRVTVRTVTRWEQVLTGGLLDDYATEISYRPVIKEARGYVDGVDTHCDATTVTLTVVTADRTEAWSTTVRLVGADHPMGNATPYVIDVTDAADQDAAEASAEAPAPVPAEAAPVAPVQAPASVAEAADYAEPVMIEYPADVMAEARTLRMGDHVSGRTSDRKYFDGYLCADPSEGRDRHGNHAIVIMIASAPVTGKGAPWCLTGTARFTRLPADPAVVAEGETLSAMFEMRRAGYTVTGVRCDTLTTHHAHIYRRAEAPARTRFACRGLRADLANAPDEGAEEMRAASLAVAARDKAAEAVTVPVVPVPTPAPVPAVTEAVTAVPPVATVASGIGPVDTHGCPMASVNAYGRYGHRVGCPDHAEPSDVPATEPVPAPKSESETPMPTTTTEAVPVPAGRLVATVDRAHLVGALAHLVKFAPSKGGAPDYACVTVAADGRYAVTVTARGWDAVMTASLDASVAVTGSVMINAKALVKLVKATPAPRGRNAAPTMVTLAHQGDQVTITAGATALVADAVYPTVNLGPVPVVPVAPVQTASTSDFTKAVSDATVAAGTDDTLPVLMGVQVTTTREGDELRLLATDRYRAADVVLPVRYCLDADTDAREHVTPGLAPARFLDLVAAVAGKSDADIIGMTTFAVQGDAWFGYRVGRYTVALRATTGEFPNVRTLFGKPTTAHVSANGIALAAMIERVATDAGPSDPVKLTVTADANGNVSEIIAYRPKNSAREAMPATGRAVNGFSFGVNPAYASAALCRATRQATVSLVDNRTPVVITGESGLYRALLMPVRLDGSTCDQAAPVGKPAQSTEVAPVQVTEVPAPVADPVDVYAADEIETAGPVRVTVHGRNGNGELSTLTGTVRNVTTCLTGRVAGKVRVLLDTGRTIYVPVTATKKEDTMTTTSTDIRDLDAQKRAGAAFQHATDGNYAEARSAMAEAAAMVPADFLFGDRFTAGQIMTMIDAHEATGGFTPAEAATVQPTEATPAPVATEAPAEASADQGDAVTEASADTDMAARVRDILSRVSWQGTKIDGRSADLMTLPSGVARPVYLAIKAVIAPLGGAYVRKAGTRPAGFAFTPPSVIHSTGTFTASGREKVAGWLAGDVPAEATEATTAPAPVQVTAEAPAPVQLPATDAVDAAYAAGYAAALAALATTTTTAAPEVTPDSDVPADGQRFTFGAWEVTNVTYNDARTRVVAALQAAGITGVTVVKVARKGADRNKITVTAPASVRKYAYAVVSGEIAAMIPADVNA